MSCKKSTPNNKWERTPSWVGTQGEPVFRLWIGWTTVIGLTVGVSEAVCLIFYWWHKWGQRPPTNLWTLFHGVKFKSWFIFYNRSSVKNPTGLEIIPNLWCRSGMNSACSNWFFISRVSSAYSLKKEHGLIKKRWCTAYSLSKIGMTRNSRTFLN